MRLSSSPHSSASGSTATAEFAMAFTSAPRGARLARLFVSHALDSWDHPYDSDINGTLTLITAELCANAVRHGRVPGRDFHVRLAREADGERLRQSPLSGSSSARSNHHTPDRSRRRRSTCAFRCCPS
ncbi:hypothetical protein [Streptomyces nigrescens]|uniref:hypothetical protein n=1 Tax=Streptomyces nigrescens TaxID=1920 RepID=UPI0039659F59